MNNVIIRKIKIEEIDAVSKLFARSFFDDPLYRYFFSNENRRSKNANFLFKFELLSLKDSVYVTSDLSAAIVIKKPYDKEYRPSVLFCIKLFFNIGLTSTVKAVKYLTFADKGCKKHIKANDAYVKLLCVDKEKRGQKIATHLMNLVGDNSAYLETQNLTNVGIYEHFGFKLLDEILFEKGVIHYCMRKSK